MYDVDLHPLPGADEVSGDVSWLNAMHVAVEGL
jgi:hypothetical protein